MNLLAIVPLARLGIDKALDFLSTDFSGKSMKLFDPLGELLKLFFGDAEGVGVPGLDIGFLQEHEEAVVFGGVPWENRE
jgi:hypothetical protein